MEEIVKELTEQERYEEYRKNPVFDKRVEIFNGEERHGTVALCHENRVTVRLNRDGGIDYGRIHDVGISFLDHGASYFFSTYDDFRKYVDDPKNEADIRRLLEGKCNCVTHGYVPGSDPID